MGDDTKERPRVTIEELQERLRKRDELALAERKEDALEAAKRRDLRDVGGTPGGLGELLVGVAMAAAGAWMLLLHMRVTTGFGALYGFHVTGPAMLALFVGIGILFFDARRKLGWLLCGGSLAVVVATTLMNLRVLFAPTGMLSTVGMFVLLAGGLGLVARSLRPHGGPRRPGAS